MSAQHVRPSAPARPAARKPRDSVSRREGLLLCEYFLASLTGCDHGWLEVITMPAPEPQHAGHMIRVVARQNPHWYQHFCSLHLRSRGRFTSRCDWCRGHHRRGGPCPSRRRNMAQALRLYKGTLNHHTIIKRRETVRALERILDGGMETVYTERLKEFIRDHGREYLKD